MAYFCYILECADGTYYTGWTTDPSRRVRQHNLGTGSRYTRMHRPVKLVFMENVETRSIALKRERQLKQQPRSKKTDLIQSHLPGVRQALTDAEWLITAPGRVNLLGEHIDYNGGPVLPVAIDRNVLAAVSRNIELVHEIHALDLHEKIVFGNESLSEKKDISGNPLPAWANYPAGVAWAALQRSLPVNPIKAAFSATLPAGAGLSSSAAIEVAFALAWQTAGRWRIKKLALAQLCLQAEVEYVGLNCGLMDQLACLFGKAGHMLFFDTTTFDWSALPLPAGLSLVVVDSGIRHTLTHSGYNDRRAECDQALAILQRAISPAPNSLAEVSLLQFQQSAHLLPDVLHKRARHVIEECDRVHQAKILLQNEQVLAFGQLMFAGHQSLRNLYDVSLPELDFLVDTAKKIPGCLGARLTGAGFGGCTINLVENGKVESFTEIVRREYLNQTGKSAGIIPCQAADGANVISLS